MSTASSFVPVTPTPSDRTSDRDVLPALFEQQVRRSPDAPALVHDGVPFTYRALNSRVNQLARYLRRHGVAPDVRVGVYVERTVDAVTSLMAIVKAGGAYVPLDPTFPAARIARIVAGAGVPLIVCPRRLDVLDGFTGETIALDEHARAIGREDARDLPPIAAAAHGLAVLYTSGSTGEPKGIVVPRSMAHHVLAAMWERFPFRPGDASLQHRSLTVIGSLWDCFGTLLHGVRSILLAGDDARDPQAIWTRLLDHRISHISLSPTLIDAIARHGERHGLVSTAMRFTWSTGESLRVDTAARWTRCFPQASLINVYGSTEAPYTALCETSRLPATVERVPAGIPLPVASIRLLDDEMEPVAPGETGEICVSSPLISRGYLGAPHLTAERFVADPCASGGRLYRMGDLGRWRSDGLLEVTGRRDRQVKINGFRIELDDVEAAVARVTSARRVAVVLRDDAKGRARLVACLETDAPIVAEDIRRALRSVVPEYMVPSTVVRVASMPLTIGGKLDRRALLGRLQDVNADAGPAEAEASVIRE